MTGKGQEPEGVLVYDGECALCRACVQRVLRGTRPGQLSFLPYQSPEARAGLGALPEETGQRAMVLVLSDGHAFVGSEALPPLLRMSKGWGWLAVIFAAPGSWHACCTAHWPGTGMHFAVGWAEGSAFDWNKGLPRAYPRNSAPTPYLSLLPRVQTTICEDT